MKTITIFFAGIIDQSHSRGLLTRLREPTTAEAAVWPAVKDVLCSMGEIINVLKEGRFQKISPMPVFWLSPGNAKPLD